jgi:hypothetical protein
MGLSNTPNLPDIPNLGQCPTIELLDIVLGDGPVFF